MNPNATREPRRTSPRDRKGDREAFTVAVWCRLADYQYQKHLMPLVESSEVERVILFRRFPSVPHPKISMVCAPRFLRWCAPLSVAYLFLETVRRSLRPRFDFAFGITGCPHALMARVAGLIGRRPSGAWWIGTDLYVDMRRPFLGPLQRAALAGSRLTLTMGEGGRALLAKMGWNPDRTWSLPLAHELERFAPRPQPTEWDIINVSRHEKGSKRLHILLCAVAILKRDLPGVRCAFVGGGPDRRRLERLSRRLGLEEDVEFLGLRRDVPDLLNRSRVFAMCSAWEGLPEAMVEALCCGLPVVVTPAGDTLEVAEHEKNALVVTSDRPEDFADALRRCLTDAGLLERLRQGALDTREGFLKADPEAEALRFWDGFFAELRWERENPA